MSLQDLKSVLQNQVNTTGSITVNAATLTAAKLTPSNDFDKTIQSCLILKSSLTVSVKIAIPDPVGNQLTIPGTASFLGVNSVDVQIIFTLETDNTTNALIIAILPVAWSFSTSFPMLAGFPFEDIQVSQPSYLLTTASTSTYNWNSNLLNLTCGLNFVSYLGMGGPLQILGNIIDNLLPADKVIFTGTIDTSEITEIAVGMPGLALTGTILKSVKSNTHFDLSLPQVLLSSFADENGQLAYWLIFSTTISVNGKPFSKIQTGIFNDSGTLNLSLLPTSDPITPADIVKLIGGVDYTNYIPSELLKVFDTVGLVGLYSSINVKTMGVLALSGSIGTKKPWSMGQFTVENIVLNCQVLYPFDPAKSVLVSFIATAKIFPNIFKGIFDFELNYDITTTELTIASNFSGTVGINDLVEGLSNGSIVIPKSLADIEFDDFGMAFTKNGSNYDYSLYGSAKGTFNISILDSPIVATFEINVDSASETYTLIGGLTISNSYFEAEANLSGGKQILSGSWTALNEDYLKINDILSAFKLPPVNIPDELDLDLKAASISYDLGDEILVLTASSANYGNAVFVAYKNATTQKWQFYFGLIVGKPINLSNLPLINKVLSDDEKIEIKDLQVLIASAPLDPNKPADKAEMALINNLIEAGYPQIPQQGLPGTVALSANFDFGGFVFPLSISTPGKTATPPGIAAPAANSGTSVGNATGSNSGSIPPPTQAADGATWFNIQKSFGPVNFEKIGVKYEDGVLWFLLNASLTAAGLEISVVGLAVGSPLKSFDPEFNIEGLGIQYANQAVTIGGAFLKMPVKPPITLEFGGTATIQLTTFGISAIGAYAQFSGQTSMFVFASVNAPFGGPAFFFVTGFCGGFGYNSKLRIPGQNEVYQFPFVASLSDPNVLGNNPTPTEVLQKVMGGTNPWVTPSAGDVWLSAGIQFTTFEVVNSTALLVAEFGSKFLLALIGLSKARFPMEGPEVYAYVELQLEVIFDPSDGVISMTAVLSPNSFILDKACHLTGGFAMVFWFGPSPYAGDFVITLGGYSPYFTPPDYYPQEPRLGFNWALDSTISITGGVYFALTPAAIMAGGSLNATYQSGNLKAWFTAYADIIIWYNPFHFIADIGINVGASYKADLLFCSKTFTVELGADLTLWGPATGGTATIHWFVISFTVKFGADQSNGLEKQTWSDFIKVLPTPENVVKIVPLSGLLSGQAPSADTGNALVPGMAAAPVSSTEPAPWIVRADSFQFTTNSSIPISELYVDGNPNPVKKGSELNIKPMEATKLTSKKTLSIINKETGKNVLDSTWNIEFLSGNVPSALWGTGSNRKLPSGDYLIADQLAGFRIKVPSPSLGTGTGDINIQEDLQYDPLSPGVNPLQLGLSPQGPVPAVSDQTISDIEQIMSESIKTQRDNVFDTFAKLGLDGLTNGNLTHLAANAGALFSDEPLLINS